MEIIEDRSDDITILKIHGELIRDNLGKLKKTLTHLLTRNCAKLIIDMEKVNLIDSSCLALLVNMCLDFQKKQGNIYLAGMNENVRSIFDATYMNNCFGIFPSVEKARENI